MPIAVIADIVGSRRLPDRAAAQRFIDDAVARVEDDLPLATQPLTPTVGDELQAIYPTLDDALASLLLFQLALPDGVTCRFGLGVGEVKLVHSAAGQVPEGPGWWAAREAINAVHAMQQRTAPDARTWIVVSDGQDAAPHASASFANAYLLARDQIVGAMTDRVRRLTYGRCMNRTQAELARTEGITQPAVSQLLAAAGSAAVITGFRTLRNPAS